MHGNCSCLQVKSGSINEDEFGILFGRDVEVARPALAGAQWAVVDPIDHQLSLPEVPTVVPLHKMPSTGLKRSSDSDWAHQTLRDVQSSKIP
jgi:hypothetical protein